jgi:hypothetical protein
MRDRSTPPMGYLVVLTEVHVPCGTCFNTPPGWGTPVLLGA